MAEDHDAMRPSYYLFGSGEVDPDNAANLLDAEFPEEVIGEEVIGVFYRPPGPFNRGTVMKAVLDRVESKRLLGPHGTVATDDPIGELLARREAGDRIMMIAIWPETPNKEEEALVLAARAEGIRVVALNHAMDDLLWEPEPEEEEAAAVEAAPEAGGASVVLPFSDDEIRVLKGIVAGILAIPGVTASPQARTRNAEDDELLDPPPFIADRRVPLAADAEETEYYRNLADGSHRKARPRGNRRTRIRDGEEQVMLTGTAVSELKKEGVVFR